MGFREFATRSPILSFYLVTFGISWGGAGVVVLGLTLRGQGLSYFTGLLLFPVLIVGPFVSGLVHLRIVDGHQGWRNLRLRFGRGRLEWRWLLVAAFAIPAAMLLILGSLSHFVSSTFYPHFWWLGFTFGIPPGILEEFGWTGFAFPKLSAKYDPRRAALIIAPIWGIWHAPVVDFLGAAYPHGNFWVPFFLAFVALVAAARVLIAWVYANTGNVPSTQLMHVSLTGSLVLLAPAAVLPWQEAGWYALVAALLWLAALGVMLRYGATMTRKTDPGAPPKQL